jgi:hypothetical protein
MDFDPPVRRAATLLPHAAGGRWDWRLQPPSALELTSRRRPPGAARSLPTLQRLVDPQFQGAVPSRRSSGFGKGPRLARHRPDAHPARLFASAALAFARASDNPQTAEPLRASRAVRPVELAWRSNSAGSPPSERSAALQPPMTIATRDVAIDVRSRIAMQGDRLPSDSRAVNRLADEVLGRIERKLRVERERRGR